MAGVFNDTVCLLAAEAVYNYAYLIPSVLNTTSAGLTFAVFMLIYGKFSLRIYYHINAKILIFLNMFSHLLFSAVTLINYSVLFINAITAAKACDFLFYTHSCSELRRIFLFCTMLNSLTQVSLVMERVYATRHISTYEYMGSKLGYYLASACVVGSAVMVAFVTFSETPNEPLTNCFAFSSSAIGDRVYYMFALQLVLAVVTTIAYLNHVKVLKTISQNYEGCLTERYQALENKIILSNLGPLILISSAFISVYIIFSSTGYLLRPCFTLPEYKQLASIIFVMPHQSFVIMVLYLYIFKWGFDAKKKRMQDTVQSPLNDRNNYMERLREHWVADYESLNSGSASPRSVKVGFAATDY